MVLLVVDAQKAIVNERLYNCDLFKANVLKLIKAARENCKEVIFVRHDDGEGSELEKGKDGFEIYDEFEPLCNEKIFDKTANSAFKDTGLYEYLLKKDENILIVVGLQTEYCIDATVKAGFEYGIKMIVPENCNSTFDNEYMTAEESYNYYNKFIWKGRYADCISFESALSKLAK